MPVLLITLFLTMPLYPVMPLYAASPDVEEQRLSKARTANADMVTRYQGNNDQLLLSAVCTCEKNVD